MTVPRKQPEGDFLGEVIQKIPEPEGELLVEINSLKSTIEANKLFVKDCMAIDEFRKLKTPPEKIVEDLNEDLAN